MKKITQQGFTLIEMITVLSIFMIMTSIVLFNYKKFTNDTILTNMAYEVALSVREAQIYGVSVRNPAGVSSADFDSPYGIHFPLVAGGTPSYFLFADVDGDGRYDGGSTCTAGSGECVIPYAMQRNIKVTNLQFKDSGGCAQPPDVPADISLVFRRPNPEPVFNNNNSTYEFAEITLTAPNNSVRYVVVSNNGQIYVDNESSCF